MPTYEYECRSCGKRFEFFQNMKEQPKQICTQCLGTLKRLIRSGAGIIFKGPGFYATDYRKKEDKRAERKDLKENKEQKGESKPHTSCASSTECGNKKD